MALDTSLFEMIDCKAVAVETTHRNDEAAQQAGSSSSYVKLVPRSAESQRTGHYSTDSNEDSMAASQGEVAGKPWQVPYHRKC